MPKREEAPTGAPCWIDLLTSDPDRSRSFYGQLFGWTSEDAGEQYGGYINFQKDGIQVAGCMRNDGQSGTPSGRKAEPSMMPASWDSPSPRVV